MQRISKFTTLPSANCLMCKQQLETHEHLFFECTYAKEIWGIFCAEWDLKLQFEGNEALIKNMIQMKKTRKTRHLIQALVSAAIYQIRYARNRQGFHNITIPAQKLVREIRRQVTHRILQLHQYKGKYKPCMDFLLKS